MKLPLTFIALLFGCAAVTELLAQGQVTWGNNLPLTPTTPQVRAPIYGLPAAGTTPIDEIRRGNTSSGLPAGTQTYTGPLLSGTGFTMAIYFGRTSEEALANNNPPSVGGSTTFRTGLAAGFIATLLSTLDGIPQGTVGANYQLRAWDNANGTITSWSQVMAGGGMVPSGTSDVYVLFEAIGGAGGPTYAAGIRSFQLTQVPEPNLIALGVLGLGALLLCRRK